ncbi:hypothetical protein [Streptomyces sp. NPDC090445]|uniref:hypothetical protein n=1 Tax=Streptomyces sp. NPDC090445 TaxID=3365963 RepID=UPI0037FACDB1
MKPDSAVDRRPGAPARATDYDTSEMLRQVFLRARSAPPPPGLAAPLRGGGLAGRAGTDAMPHA